jgi:hypothetical protein
VLVGAASEMGPLEHVTRWGATVVALDLPREHLWDRIRSAAQTGSGRTLLPTREGAAGCDLLTQIPDIRAWLETIDGPLVVGNYVYADGANFVRVATAVDALVADLADAGKLAASAYLATPTDVYAVPAELARSTRPGKERGRILRAVTGKRAYARQYEEEIAGDDGRRWSLADSLVAIQGANYALAKQIQRWRAVTTRDAGIPTSANVAPATATISVTKNRVLAAAYRGAPRYGVEIFEPATSRALMALLLAHDLRYPSDESAPVGHPYDLFVDQAAHGGIWRIGYEPRSVLPLAVLRGLVRR